MQTPASEPASSSGTDPLDVWANLRIPGVTNFLADMVRSTTGDDFLLTTSSEGLILYTVGASAITVGTFYIAPVGCASYATHLVYGGLAASIQYLGINALGNAINDAHHDSTFEGTAENALLGGLMSMMGRLFRGGCFVAGTQVTVSDLPLSGEVGDSCWSDSSWSAQRLLDRSVVTADPWMDLARVQQKVSIESLPIGSRVPTKNPNRWEVDPQPEPDETTWAKLSITVQRTDGGIVDAEIIRPRAWIEAYDLQAGRRMPLNLPELKVLGVATITALNACPPIADGEGSVVTASFVTREVHVVASVDVLGPDGLIETITGTGMRSNRCQVSVVL